MLLAAATADFITRQDHRLMRHVHRWHAPRWIRLWTVCATRGGDGSLWSLCALLVLEWGGPHRIAAVAAAALATAVGILVFLRLKRWTGRRRPCALEHHCWATLMPPDQFSFPSGHTITAFAVVTPLMLDCPPHWQIPLLFCALSVSASRIVLGMHFLSDVLAGGVIGTLLGLTMQRLVG